MFALVLTSPINSEIARRSSAEGYDFLAFRRLDETASLIADIHMPGMTGVELYARLIEAGQEIPTILVTAYPDEATRARVLKDGILCYLLKPFDDNDLMDCVRKAIEGGKPPAPISRSKTLMVL